MIIRKVVLFLLVVIGCCSCITSKYNVVKESELAKVDVDNSTCLFVPIADQDLKTSSLLDSTCSLIRKRRFLKLERYINEQEKNGADASDVALSKTLFFLSVNDYVASYKFVDLINESDYPLLKELLLIDLFCEIEKSNGSYGYNVYLKRYQTLVDTYPDNEWLKKIISLRIRFLRYNK